MLTYNTLDKGLGQNKPDSIMQCSNNQESPIVSIITPHFNTSPQIFQETIDCVLKQTFKNFEWLIIDDHSTNQESLDFIKTLSSLDSRIRLISKSTNEGPSAARNTGIKSAKGSYLFFVDSDDLIDHCIIEKYLIFLEINKEFAFCNSWHKGFGAQSYEWKRGFEENLSFLYENPIQPTFMARKNLFQFVQFDETIRDGFEDWDFWLKCASRGFWGYTISDFLYSYRRVENTAEKWKNWDNSTKTEAFKKHLLEKYEATLKRFFPNPNLTHFERGVNATTDIFGDADSNQHLPSQPKSIVFFFPWLALGGADKFNLDLIRGLSENNWTITIITTQFSDNPWEKEFRKYTDQIFHLHLFSQEPFYLEIIKFILNQRQPQCIVFSNSEIGYYLSPLIKLNFPQIPFYDYNHMEESYWNKGGHPKQTVIYQDLFEKNLVSSQHLKEWMKEQGASEEKIEVIYTGSDFENLLPDPQKRNDIRKFWNVDDDLCIITFSGRLTEQKQPMVLLNTIKELSKLISEGFVLIIAGDGNNIQFYKEWVAQNDLNGKIWFMGAVSNQQNLDILKGSDIFFLPSLWEGISLAIYEAMTLGLPIVGANVGGQAELVKNGAGILIDKSNPEREAKIYAHALHSLILSKEKRALMGKKGREIIENEFGIKKSLSRFEEILLTRPQNTNFSIQAKLKQTFALLLFEKKLADNLWTQLAQIKSTKEHFQDSTVGYTPSMQRNWYFDNYESLPIWFKKFGQIVKVVYGKKKLKTVIFKKYKPDPTKYSHEEWYAMEYESLPNWYKKLGKYLKKI